MDCSLDNNCRPAWDEAKRSAVLHSYDVLDTPREQDFDELVQLAAEICGTPIAVVNLVDTSRQFFKAEVGLGVRETPLETSFCGTAILAEEMMIVPDASKDPRFQHNPLVTGEPNLRFYAGALLRSPEGLPIGTVCVLDYLPRELSGHQVRMLRLLARQAMTQLDLRRTLAAQTQALEAAHAAESEKALLARIVEQSSDFFGMADTAGRIFFLNDAARRMVGLAEADISTTHVVDYFVDADRQTIIDDVMPGVGKDEDWEGELRFRNFETGDVTPVLFNIFSLLDASGALIGYGAVAKDISLQKEEQRRRTEITREMSHRLRNTLAMVQAIVTQTFRMTKTVEEGREAISGRLNALARAQDILTSTDTSLARLGDVVGTALAPHRTGQGRFSLAGPPIDLTAPQALGLSLALHELATNAAKYGALTEPEGAIQVHWHWTEGRRFRIEWIETGGPKVSVPTRKGFGSKLLERIVAPYFEGEARLEFAPDGVRFRLEGEMAIPDDALIRAAG